MNKNFMNRYHIALNGGVGVSKSTICSAIQSLFFLYDNDAIIEPRREYLQSSKIGPQMLSYFLNGSLNILPFQYYILDTLVKTSKECNNKPIQLYERTIDDCVIIFSNTQNQNSNISDQELLNLYTKSKQIAEKYDILHYQHPKLKLTRLDSSKSLLEKIKLILEIMIQDLDEENTHRLIGLEIDDELAYTRVFEDRGREDEKSYPKTYLKNINRGYKNLLDMIEKGDYRRFTDLGKIF